MARAKRNYTKRVILTMLADGKPRSFREIVKEAGLDRKAVEGALYRLWRRGYILRSEKPLMESQRIFKGRAGVTRNLRKYHLYIIRPERTDTVEYRGIKFVSFDEAKYKEVKPKISKAKLILEFLKKHKDRAFFSKEIAEALKDKG
ncbi:MAG: hypothetical protein J7L38_07075, partial [Thermoproteales archaeon]|nr:hypothetical protein [Thermoproteales archaeon]